MNPAQALSNLWFDSGWSKWPSNGAPACLLTSFVRCHPDKSTTEGSRTSAVLRRTCRRAVMYPLDSLRSVAPASRSIPAPRSTAQHTCPDQFHFWPCPWPIRSQVGPWTPAAESWTFQCSAAHSQLLSASHTLSKSRWVLGGIPVSYPVAHLSPDRIYLQLRKKVRHCYHHVFPVRLGSAAKLCLWASATF